MITDQHPITPPPELVEQWWQATMPNIETSVKDQLCTQAARWGADQELEACCEWLKAKEWIHPEFSDELRAARRSKPPSLAEQALEACERSAFGIPGDRDIIRAALERLQELESNG